jgi:hypothetical protein
MFIARESALLHAHLCLSHDSLALLLNTVGQELWLEGNLLKSLQNLWSYD